MCLHPFRVIGAADLGVCERRRTGRQSVSRVEEVVNISGYDHAASVLTHLGGRSSMRKGHRRYTAQRSLCNDSPKRLVPDRRHKEHIDSSEKVGRRTLSEEINGTMTEFLSQRRQLSAVTGHAEAGSGPANGLSLSERVDKADDAFFRVDTPQVAEPESPTCRGDGLGRPRGEPDLWRDVRTPDTSKPYGVAVGRANRFA